MIWDWILDNIIALAALVVAGWSAWYTKKYSGQQTELHRESLEIEKKRERDKIAESKKAKFDVNLVKESNNKGRKVYKSIRLTNIGECDAKNVRWTINGILPSRFEDILDKDPDIDHIKLIRSATPKVFKITTDKDSDKTWIVKVIWDDRASKNNKDEFELRL